MIIKAGLAVLWLLPAASVFGGAAIWTVTVVDTEANPVSGAEVVVYEYEYDYQTTISALKRLCPAQETDARGQVEMSFTFDREVSVMIVARKAGRAMGWDTLPYKDTASPRVNIVLEMPVPLPGRVLDHEGNPVADAGIQAIPKTSVPERLSQRSVNGPVDWMQVRTDAEGRFLFNCFAADTYADFHITPSNSKTTFILTPYYLSRCGFETGRDEVTLTLPKPAILKGRVVDDRGRGIAGLRVVCRPDLRDLVNYRYNNYAPHVGVTNEEGEFCFQDVPVCEHFLEVLNNDTARPWAGKTVNVDASDKAVADDIVIQLDIGGILKVTAVDERTQRPVVNAIMSFSRPSTYQGERYYRNAMYTDSEGKADIVLPDGTFRMSSYAQGYPYSSEYELPVIEKGKTVHLRIEMTSFVAVSGIVQDVDGRPVSGVVAGLTWGQKVLTDSDGRFQCVYDDRNFREGMCMIVRQPETHRAAVQVVGDPAAPMTLVLRPAQRLIGTVVDESNEPVPASRVALHFSGPGYLSDLGEETLADAKGCFSFDAVPADLPDKFSFRISVSAANYGPVGYGRLAIDNQTDMLMTLSPIMLKATNCSVSGTVFGQDGLPVALMPVMQNQSGQPRRSTVTNTNGRFEIRRVCQGPLRLQAGIGGGDFEPGYITANGGDTQLMIYLGKDRLHVPETPSLVGKPLPDLSGYGLAGAAEPSPTLVCLWDWRQRPSRYAVRQLAEQADALAERSVQVVLLNAEPTEREPLEAWLNEYGIAFDCGVIDDNAEKTRFALGASALPWLILTDAEGSVVAEGFDVSELTSRLDGVQ